MDNGCNFLKIQGFFFFKSLRTIHKALSVNYVLLKYRMNFPTNVIIILGSISSLAIIDALRKQTQGKNKITIKLIMISLLWLDRFLARAGVAS